MMINITATKVSTKHFTINFQLQQSNLYHKFLQTIVYSYKLQLFRFKVIKLLWWLLNAINNLSKYRTERNYEFKGKVKAVFSILH